MAGERSFRSEDLRLRLLGRCDCSKSSISVERIGVVVGCAVGSDAGVWSEVLGMGSIGPAVVIGMLRSASFSSSKAGSAAFVVCVDAVSACQTANLPNAWQLVVAGRTLGLRQALASA